MRLSDAIRLGAMLRPQAAGFYFMLGTSCAFGAAMEALGQVYDEGGGDYQQITAAYPFIHEWHKEQVKCPQCQVRAPAYEEIVAHLNDDHRLSREQIADWVEEIETCAERTQATQVERAALIAAPVL